MSALHVIPDEIYHFSNFGIILSCTCTNCSAIMVTILDFTVEAGLSISETTFPATGNIRHQDREENSYISHNMAISAVLDILAAILDSGDRIAKPTSIIVLQPLIIHKKW